MTRRTCYLLLAMGLLALVSTGDAEEQAKFAVDADTPPAEWVLREAPVLSAEQSLEQFDLPPGFRIEVVAAEPLVEDPINITFGHDGRIWVVEYPGYNRQIREDFGFEALDEHPGDRLVVLEDTTGDGQMDQRTVFKDNLQGPRTISIIDDGVLVADPPEVWYYRDTTGDGKADWEEKILDDYGSRPNPHVMPGGLMWAMDNWLYSTIDTKRLRWNGGEWLEDGPLVAKGQWGITQDNWGRIYYNRQADPLRADLVPVGYWPRNPNYREAAGINERLAHNMDVWPHGPTPGVQPVHLDDTATLFRFTSASSPVIYRGENFPQEMVGDAFVTVPTANFVRQFKLTEEDGVIDAVNRYEDHEFLFSHDERFRPSDQAVGPDGALYVVDMYRGIIEGHPWLEDAMRDYVMARNLHEPFTGLGRIYRIVHEDGPVGDWPAMHREDAQQWVEHLKRPNGWWRDNAQRLLIERGETDVAPALRSLAEDTSLEPYVRLHALWTLEGLDTLEPGDVKRALEDPSFRVREHALRLAERWLDESGMLAAVLERVEDERVEVRRQLLFTLGEVEEADFDRAEQAMRQVLHRDADAAYTVEAALSGLHGRELSFLQTTLREWDEAPAGGNRFASLFAEAVTNEGDAAKLMQLASLAGGEGWWRPAILTGMENGRTGNLTEAPDVVRYLLNLPDDEMRQQATALVAAIDTSPNGNDVDVDALEESVRELYERGRAGYLLCAACHQADGQGMEDIAPPLAGSEWLGGEPDGLLRITLQGLNAREDYPVMAAMSGLDDEQLAAILTYVRLTWSDDGEAILPEDIDAAREATEGRLLPWTFEELEELK